MPLRVIGAGLGRTGTLSLKLALEQLGFGPCYHMMEVLPRPERVAQWSRIAAGEPADWEQVFAGFAATVDWPACNYYRQLMASYPDAKVILSLRDADGWFRSTQVTIFGEAVQRVAAPFVAKVLGDVVGDDLRDRARCIAGFERHNAEVRATVPEDRLLVFEVARGWQPLCAFLGVAVPAGPFPVVNTTKQFQEMLASSAAAGEEA